MALGGFAPARRAAAIWVALGCAACTGPGQYVWFHDLPPQGAAAGGQDLIRVGDTVTVRVLGHDDVSVKEKVRADGRMAIPLIGEVQAVGKQPSGLRGEIEARLKDFIVSPSVMVNLDEVQPVTVVVLGEVVKPGAYQLDRDAGVAAALAMAGGLTDFASRDGIYVVRHDPAPRRVRFTYLAISRNEEGAGLFPLHTGDVVEVE